MGREPNWPWHSVVERGMVKGLSLPFRENFSDTECHQMWFDAMKVGKYE